MQCCIELEAKARRTEPSKITKCGCGKKNAQTPRTVTTHKGSFSGQHGRDDVLQVKKKAWNHTQYGAIK